MNIEQEALELFIFWISYLYNNYKTLRFLFMIITTEMQLFRQKGVTKVEDISGNKPHIHLTFDALTFQGMWPYWSPTILSAMSSSRLCDHQLTSWAPWKYLRLLPSNYNILCVSKGLFYWREQKRCLFPCLSQLGVCQCQGFISFQTLSLLYVISKYLCKEPKLCQIVS